MLLEALKQTPSIQHSSTSLLFWTPQTTRNLLEMATLFLSGQTLSFRYWCYWAPRRALPGKHLSMTRGIWSQLQRTAHVIARGSLQGNRMKLNFTDRWVSSRRYFIGRKSCTDTSSDERERETIFTKWITGTQSLKPAVLKAQNWAVVHY